MDAINFYGCAMSQPPALSNFEENYRTNEDSKK